MNNTGHSAKRPAQNVRATSKENFANHIASGKSLTEWQKTAAALGELGEASRLMLKVKTGLEINHITQAVKTLLKKGIAEELPDKRRCKVSKNKAYYLRLTEKEKDNTMQIKLSDILKELLRKAKAEKQKADNAKTDQERREHLEQANEYLQSFNDLTPDEKQKELYT